MSDPELARVMIEMFILGRSKAECRTWNQFSITQDGKTLKTEQ